MFGIPRGWRHEPIRRQHNGKLRGLVGVGVRLYIVLYHHCSTSRFGLPQELLSDDSLVRRTEEMVESMLLKHGILENKQRPKRTLSYVTKSHAFSCLIAKKRMSFQADFFFDLVDPVKTSAFRNDGPDPSEDENKSHHGFF